MLSVPATQQRQARQEADAIVMQQALKVIFFAMPFLFGIGFIAPVTAELMALVGVEAPLGLSRIGFGLLFGGLWGAYATIKGSWL
ncbi:MAG TPA: hypothetical protein VF619_02200 [Allosphingosinicella sp.]|jgi:hypothetical protein